MAGNSSEDNTNRGKLIRALAIIILAGAALVIILSVLVFPRMENAFLVKGIEYAKEKTMSTLPTVEGFNPKIHKHDPLEVVASFNAVHAALQNDSLKSERLQDSAAEFMKTFKGCYDDQIIIPDEQTVIVNGLNALERWILKEHFNHIKNPTLFVVSEALDSLPVSAGEVMGFDSIAIYNDEIKLGMTAPLSLELILAYYNSINGKSVNREDADKILKIILEIERFQIKNEFFALNQLIYQSEEFKAFANKEQFQEYVDFIITKLRDRDYNYTPVKATLRSFIVLWYGQERAENFERHSIEPLYNFLKYAAGSAMYSEDKDKTAPQNDTLPE